MRIPIIFILMLSLQYGGGCKKDVIKDAVADSEKSSIVYRKPEYTKYRREWVVSVKILSNRTYLVNGTNFSQSDFRNRFLRFKKYASPVTIKISIEEGVTSNDLKESMSLFESLVIEYFYFDDMENQKKGIEINLPIPK